MYLLKIFSEHFLSFCPFKKETSISQYAHSPHPEVHAAPEKLKFFSSFQLHCLGVSTKIAATGVLTPIKRAGRKKTSNLDGNQLRTTQI